MADYTCFFGRAWGWFYSYYSFHVFYQNLYLYCYTCSLMLFSSILAKPNKIL